MHEMFERIKSTDFPIECRGMYYFMKGRHAHQTRKVSGLPYYIHPRGVAYLVMNYHGTIDQINAALGHDLLEDTETSYAEIKVVSNSNHCADLCSELRNNRFVIKEIGKEKYLENKLSNLSEEALLIKLADMLYNINDNPTPQAKERMKNNVKTLLEHREINKDCQDIIVQILNT